MVDTRDLKSLDLTVVPVRFRPRAPLKTAKITLNLLTMLTTTEHSREREGFKYIYPVISRRSGGLSVGINLNTNNACNWRCIYCQVPQLTRGSAPPVNLETLQNELRFFLDSVLHGDFYETEEIPKKLQEIKDIAVSGNGEPTTADEFEQVVDVLKEVIKDLPILKQIKCVLISNGSLVNRDYVQRGLSKLAEINGEVWFKIDSATPKGMEKINQISGNELSTTKRLAISAKLCPTYIQTCMFMFNKSLPSPTEINAYLEMLSKVVEEGISIKGVLLYGVERPSLLPEAAEKIAKLPEDWMLALGEKIKAIGLDVKVSV